MTSILKVSEIQDPTNSNTALSIDTSGRITTPARPAFSVKRVDTAATGTTGQIQFNTVDTNINSCWDTTNYRFEAPVNGVYHFSFTGMAAGTTSGGHFPANSSANAVIEKSTDSGSNWSHLCNAYAFVASSTSFPNITSSGTFTLNSGDYVRVNMYTLYVYSNSSTFDLNPTFSGFLLG